MPESPAPMHQTRCWQLCCCSWPRSNQEAELLLLLLLPRSNQEAKLLLPPFDEEELPEPLQLLPHLRVRVVPALSHADAGASSTTGFGDEADADEPIVAGKGGGGGGTTA